MLRLIVRGCEVHKRLLKCEGCEAETPWYPSMFKGLDLACWRTTDMDMMISPSALGSILLSKMSN